MDQLQGMRVFARVAELGSFARAADDLDMSRAMASSYVAQLEKHLGTRLLHRTTRKVTVSPEGAVYLERCKRILAEVQAADDEMRHARARPQGKLRIDVPVAFGRYLLMPALPAFTERYPGALARATRPTSPRRSASRRCGRRRTRACAPRSSCPRA